jgi:predicted Zn-dependent protease
MSRLEQIKTLLAEDPLDTFLRYALAMELRSQEVHDESLAEFEKCMANQPPHVPSYFMCGQLLAEMNQLSRARAVLREGIEHARNQKDLHASGEMSELLASLGELGE